MIEGVEVKTLKPLFDERGKLFEVLRNDDKFYNGFGQAFISTIRNGVVKAWHMHQLQTDYYCVLKGMCRIVLLDRREKSKTFNQKMEFYTGEENPLLIKIPPYILHGIKCYKGDEAILLAITDVPYNRVEPDEIKIPYDRFQEINWECENK